jgi:hypothetical protein
MSQLTTPGLLTLASSALGFSQLLWQLPFAAARPDDQDLVNPLVSGLRTGGVATLTVVGRNSGRPRTVPVIPVEVDGVRYLVSPFGESEWVRNLQRREPGSCAATLETFQAAELPVAQRTRIIAAYRKGARRDVGPVLHSAARSRRPSHLPDHIGEQSATNERTRLTPEPLGRMSAVGRQSERSLDGRKEDGVGAIRVLGRRRVLHGRRVPEEHGDDVLPSAAARPAPACAGRADPRPCASDGAGCQTPPPARSHRWRHPILAAPASR